MNSNIREEDDEKRQSRTEEKKDYSEDYFLDWTARKNANLLLEGSWLVGGEKCALEVNSYSG